MMGHIFGKYTCEVLYRYGEKKNLPKTSYGGLFMGRHSPLACWNKANDDNFDVAPYGLQE